MVEERHRELGKEIGGHTANASFRALSAIWGYAEQRVPELPANPVKRLKRKWFREERRQRLVGNEQLADFYSAVMALSNAVVRDCILLILFSGLRYGESISLRWDDVDLAKRTINLRAEVTKAKRAISLPISDYVFDLLVARRALGRAEYVFPGPGRHGHITDLQSAFKEIESQTQTSVKVSPHDLRRGYITLAEETGLTIGVIKRLVNHASENDVTAGYMIVSEERLREAQQAITDRLKDLCGISDPEGVAKIIRKY